MPARTIPAGLARRHWYTQYLSRITLEQMHGIHTGPILKMDAALREYFVDRFHEFVHERVKLLGRWARFAHCPDTVDRGGIALCWCLVEVHGQQILRRHSGAGRVELQLADGDTRAVCAQITKSKDSAAVRDADEPNVFSSSRPVFQNIFNLAAPRNRQVHATRLPVDMTELQTRFADGRVVHNREKARWSDMTVA